MNKPSIINSFTFREIYEGYNQRCTHTYKAVITESKKKKKNQILAFEFQNNHLNTMAQTIAAETIFMLSKQRETSPKPSNASPGWN